jgi:hypothetical protein
MPSDWFAHKTTIESRGLTHELTRVGDLTVLAAADDDGIVAARGRAAVFLGSGVLGAGTLTSLSAVMVSCLLVRDGVPKSGYASTTTVGNDDVELLAGGFAADSVDTTAFSTRSG